MNKPTTVYGHDRTIHQTNHVDVEIGPDGVVVAVWFRCQMLPFTSSAVAADRASEMLSAYVNSPPAPLVAVEFEYVKPPVPPGQVSDVHTTHCCTQHRKCKYFKVATCSVVNGSKIAEYPCNCEHM